MWEACFLFDDGYEWKVMFARTDRMDMGETEQRKMLLGVKVVMMSGWRWRWRIVLPEAGRLKVNIPEPGVAHWTHGKGHP